MSELDNNNQTVAEIESEIAEGAGPVIDSAILEEMLKAGVLYGRSKSRTHPKMKKYIEMTRSGLEIFDPTQTLATLDKASDFLKDIAQKDGSILLVGTIPAAKELIKSLGDKFGLPYVTNRWLGGTLTNYKTLSQRLQHYMTLKADRETGRLEKYTKKERIKFDKEISRLTQLFGGLEKYARLPAVLLVVDSVEHSTAIREARRLKIPVIALTNSNANPGNIDYVIPCNNGARSAITWVLAHLEQAIEKGQAEKLAAPKPEIK